MKKISCGLMLETDCQTAEAGTFGDEREQRLKTKIPQKKTVANTLFKSTSQSDFSPLTGRSRSCGQMNL